MGKKDNICILLGAGVSVEQNLPDWLDLVKNTVDFYNINVGVVNKNNLLETVGIIEDNLLFDINSKVIEGGVDYKKFQSYSRMKIALSVSTSFKKCLRDIPFLEFEKRTLLMKKIVECVYKRAVNGQHTTVITYNFDDYFEFAYRVLLKNKGQKEKYNEHLVSHTMKPNSHLPSGTTEPLISVYHVHGCIPIFHKIYGKYIDSADNLSVSKNMSYEECIERGIVFSGNDYNQLMDDAIVGWTNMIQYICYSQLPVSMIGFSMSDANFRLLLRRMQKSNDSIDDIAVFWGCDSKKSDDDFKAFCEERKEITKYLLKGLCKEPETIATRFGLEYSEAVEKHLSKYLD